MRERSLATYQEVGRHVEGVVLAVEPGGDLDFLDLFAGWDIDAEECLNASFFLGRRIEKVDPDNVGQGGAGRMRRNQPFLLNRVERQHWVRRYAKAMREAMRRSYR